MESCIKCVACECMFVHINELSSHLSEFHKSLLYYRCKFLDCSRAYTRKNDFIKHYKDKHSINHHNTLSNVSIIRGDDSLNIGSSFVHDVEEVVENENVPECKIKSSLFKLAIKLYSHPKIPRSCAESTLKDFKDIMDEIITGFTMNCNKEKTFEEIFNCSPNFEFIRSEYMFFNELKNSQTSLLVPAKTYTIHREQESEFNPYKRFTMYCQICTTSRTFL